MLHFQKLFYMVRNVQKYLFAFLLMKGCKKETCLSQVKFPDNWIGWSKIALFALFEDGHIAADQLFDKEFNSKKSADKVKKKHFIPGALKIYVYLPFASKNNHKNKFRNKLGFFRPPKWEEKISTSQ